MTPRFAGCNKLDTILPDHPDLSKEGTTYRDVHHLQPVGMAYQVVREHDRPLESRVRPFRPIRVGDVEPCYADCLDLVRHLGYESFDCLLVLLAEDRRHLDGDSGTTAGRSRVRGEESKVNVRVAGSRRRGS